MKKNRLEMNTYVKIKGAGALKIKISTLLLFCCFTTNIQAQETIAETGIETQADKDWKELKYVMITYGAVKEKQKMEEGEGALGIKRYYDKYFKKRSELAKAFWYKYPQDPRRIQALKFFFSPYAQPYFVPNKISDSLKAFALTIPKRMKYLRKFYRLMPVDKVAYHQWVKAGDDMVNSILNSDADLKSKVDAEFQLTITRELNLNSRLYFMVQRKEKSEADYWEHFEIQSWKHIRLSLERFVDKYAALESVSSYVKDALGAVINYAPAVSDAYWQYFYEITGSNHPQANQLGIKALHKLAAENVAAIEALKEVDYSKPLDMVFTAIDGSIVDLNTMRGKVVLIDFWAT
ncbi:hypothetical protein Q4Q35_15520, partial [Flavivirga aquimarina]